LNNKSTRTFENELFHFIPEKVSIFFLSLIKTTPDSWANITIAKLEIWNAVVIFLPLRADPCVVLLHPSPARLDVALPEQRIEYIDEQVVDLQILHAV
jgi:hypothetical protein